MKEETQLFVILSALSASIIVLLFPGGCQSARPMPRKYGNAVPRRELETTYLNTRKKIEVIHNFFRAQVEPSAKDMLEMKWHEEAADDAQRWAEGCELLVHDNVTGRWVDNYGSCGQNIFVANVQVPWFFAVKTWFLEKLNFTYGSADNDLGIVGHYTQLVWYNTHEVGCGFHYCDVKPKPFYNYVCNYCPIGNFPERLGRPYDKGTPCEDCEDSCKFKKLCTNPCPYADQWANCKELNSTWHNWLCNGEHAPYCLATCRCGSDTIK